MTTSVLPSPDEDFMRVCLKLARRGAGRVSPNPMVGAVLMRDGRVVASGYHTRYGAAHAEVECLRKFQGDCSAATLYVNLEPCSHYGKTPPCVDLIVQRGIKRVVIAMKDPNPLVNGKGIRKLRRAGVHVRVGVLRQEAEQLNRFFVKHITTGLPYVHVKVAQTRDGYIAQSSGKSVYITGRRALALVHRWRSEYDAVLVGARTVLADNPRLTVRLVSGRDPDVVILDGNFSVTGNERVFASAHRRRVFLCVTERSYERKRTRAARLEAIGTVILKFQSVNRRIPLRSVLKSLYAYNIGSILVEGGRDVFSQFVEHNLVDEISIFVSPATFGAGIAALTPAARRKVERWIERGEVEHRTLGRDHLYTRRIE